MVLILLLGNSPRNLQGLWGANHSVAFLYCIFYFSSAAEAINEREFDRRISWTRDIEIERGSERGVGVSRKPLCVVPTWLCYEFHVASLLIKEMCSLKY